MIKVVEDLRHAVMRNGKFSVPEHAFDTYWVADSESKYRETSEGIQGRATPQ